MGVCDYSTKQVGRGLVELGVVVDEDFESGELVFSPLI